MADATTGIVAQARGSNTTTTPQVATADDVNKAYNSLFGRPAESAALPFWTDYAQKNNLSGDQLAQKIASSAQGDDQSARSSLNGSGSLSANWVQQGLNAEHAGSADRWDASKNQWVTQPAPTAAPAATSAVSTYSPTLLGDPTKWEITPEQTVQGQITKILDPNNPIVMQARTRALQTMNDRGLLNSSIAVGAADSAAYDAAIPIATSDASTYGKAAGYNADQKNQFAVHNMDAQNTASQFNANAQNQWNIADLQASTQKYIAGLDSNTKMALANLDSGTKVQLQQLENQNKSSLQSNAAASDTFRQVLQNIATISMSKDLDGPAKQQAVNNQLAMLKAALGVNGAISGLDLSSLLDFSGVNAAPTGSSSTTNSTTQGIAPGEPNNQGGGV